MMYLRIFHRNVYLLLLVLTLLVCLGVGTSYGNVLAEKVYIKHRPVFARADVQAALPTILEQLATPVVQKLLTPASIPLVANNPELLKPVVPGASPEFIASMKEDAALQQLLQDADFQNLLQNPPAINVLVALMTGVKEPEESWVFFGGLHYPTNTLEEDVELVRNLKLGAPYLAGSQHKLIFTLTNKQTGQPVPFALLASLEDYSESTTKATFSPATITTDKNGKAETYITIGDGDFGISVDIPPGPPLTFGNYDFSSLLVDGEVLDLQLDGLVPQRQYHQRSRHKVTFTVRKQQTREPVPSIRLSLSTSGHGPTWALFNPSVILTDKNGKAETYITFPKEAGSIINISVHMVHGKMTFGNYDFSSFFFDGEMLDLQLDGLVSQRQYRQRSKHKVTFTVRKQQTREPVPFVRLNLSTSGDTRPSGAVFNPSVITTDKNGKAETEITFPEKPWSIINISVHMEHEKGVTYKRQDLYGIATYGGERFHVDHDLRTNEVYLTGSKRKVIFTVRTRESNKPVYSARLTLSAHAESTTTATFSPAVITTDKNGKAETQITFGEKPGSFSIAMNIEIDEATHVVLTGTSYYPLDGDEVELESNFRFHRMPFIPGSQHKLSLTLTNRRTGKPFPSAGISLSFREQSTTTATFSPAVITTDKNGKAETQVTFGEKPGSISFYLEIRTSQRRALFDFDIGISEIEIDVMHDGKSEKLQNFSYRLGLTKTRKKLLVKTRSLKHGHTLPDVNLVFDRVYGDVYGIATFEPKQVHTDENGQAVIDITFPAGVKDVKILVRVQKPVRVSIACTTPRWTETQASGGNAFSLWTISLKWDTEKTVAKESGTIILTIRFLDGTPEMHSFVEETASQWSDHANVKFNFLPFNDKTSRADFTIKFNAAEKARQISGVVKRHWEGVKSRAAKEMEITGLEEGLEWADKEMRDACTGLILHEFGHALGLEHEHANLTTTNPDYQKRIFGRVLETPFAWNEEALKEDGEDIDQYKLTRHKGAALRMSTPFDPKSIMGYPIQAHWNTAGYSNLLQYNELSDVDKEFIGREKLYGSPKPVIKLAGNIEGRGKVYVHEGGFLGFRRKWVDHSFYFRKPVTFFFSSGAQPVSTSFDTRDGNYFRLYVGAARTSKFTKLDGVLITMVGDLATGRRGAPYAIDCQQVGFKYGVTKEGILRVLTDSFDGGGNLFTLGTFRENTKNCYEKDIGLKLPYERFFDPRNDEKDDYIHMDFELTASPFKRSKNEPDFPIDNFTGSAAPSITLTERPPMVPQVTTLLPNYPNPFNPETWIPYHLAKPAQVTLTIYAIDGKVVRHLDLGHQLEGFYQNKSRAAYWDGRNNVGERVATGLYFYTLTTDDFAATKKMLILK